MEDDFLLDEDEDLQAYNSSGGDEDDSDEDISQVPEDEDLERLDKSEYEGKLTKDEIWLSSAYNDIIAAGKTLGKKDNSAIEDAVTTLVWANPKHNSATIINNIVKEIFHKQGHSRMVTSAFTPDSPMRGDDVDDDTTGFNKEYTQAAREQIARFIGFLASRDLSKDSIQSQRIKRRHIPAFIIFLFSSGMYDLIIDCPTMPKEYDDQIKNALNKLLKSKYDIVEELAREYEAAGRPMVAARVRKLQLNWFDKEPAEITTAANLRDLDLTPADVQIYKKYRSKFTNTSKAITQDIISDLIEVVVDSDAGIYERLKDKTRSDAISDVKQVYKNWAKDNPIDLELTNKVIWKDI